MDKRGVRQNYLSGIYDLVCFGHSGVLFELDFRQGLTHAIDEENVKKKSVPHC